MDGVSGKLPLPKLDMRKWHVDQAVHSIRSLLSVINELTLEEVESALRLESSTRRRHHVMRRLLGKAARLNEQMYISNLKKELNL